MVAHTVTVVEVRSNAVVVVSTLHRANVHEQELRSAGQAREVCPLRNGMSIAPGIVVCLNEQIQTYTQTHTHTQEGREESSAQTKYSTKQPV